MSNLPCIVFLAWRKVSNYSLRVESIFGNQLGFSHRTSTGSIIVLFCSSNRMVHESELEVFVVVGENPLVARVRNLPTHCVGQSNCLIETNE